MTTQSVEPAAAAEPTAPTRKGWSFGERLADRLNPILVREVEQALAGRSFLSILALSTFAVIGLGLMFAARERQYGGQGREAFEAVMVCLIPVATLFCPMQSFQSTRQELSGGSAEQLSLTRMSNWQIVRGKALAGLAQFAIFASLFAPLLALSYLLRGIDLISIVLGLITAGTFALVGNMLAVAAASVGRGRVAVALIQFVCLAGLITMSVIGVEFSSELPRIAARLFSSSPGESLDTLIGLAIAFHAMLFFAILFGQVAAASLAHAHMNRSTGFRVLLFTAIGLYIGVLWLTEDPLSRMFLLGGSFDTFLLLISPIWLVACCEQSQMSRHVRLHVPRRKSLAVLATPFLPGGGRGLMMTALAFFILGLTATWWCYSALRSGVTSSGWGSWSSSGNTWDRASGFWISLAVALFFGSVGCLIRQNFLKSPRGTGLSFAAVLGVIAIGSIGPVALMLLADSNGPQHYSIIHALNPLYTVAKAQRGSDAAVGIAALQGVIGCVAVLALSLPAFAEVQKASRERRGRKWGA